MSDTIKAAIITAVLALIGGIIMAALTLRGQNLDQSIELTKIALDMTKSANVTPIPSATAAPAETSAPTVPPFTPSGYVLYDDFSEPSTLQSNWRLEDGNKLCTTFKIENNSLIFECTNKTAQDLQASLNLNVGGQTIWGVATQVQVEKSGGPFQLATGWKCADGTERAYHLALSDKDVTANLFYPIKNQPWPMINLGNDSATTGKAHLLQIEADSGDIRFLLDGKAISLLGKTDFQPCLELTSIALDFYIWPENSLKGQVENFSTRP